MSQASLRMRLSFFRIATVITLFSLAAHAQTPEGHRISARIQGLKDTTLYLAHFYGPTQYIPRDTARVDGSGNLVFDGPKALPGGLYMVVGGGRPLLELVIGEQNFSFETDTANFIGKMKVTGSRENEAFYTYQQFLNERFSAMRGIQARSQPGGDAAARQAAQTQMAALQKEVMEYRKAFLAKNEGLLTVKFLKAMAEPEVPKAPTLPNGRPDSAFVFNYYKNHFFDGFDFSDERMVRTPFLQQKLDRFIKDLTVQTSDSLIKSGDFVVQKAKANKDVLSYTIWYLTSQYEQPKVVGTDGFYVHMVEKYWLTGVMPIQDTASLRSLRERVTVIKPLLPGKTLPNLSLQDTLGRYRALHDIKAPYTVVYFYDPECGHCRESAPKLKQFYDTFKAKGIQVYLIAIDKEPTKWKNFIREFKLQNLTNVYGPSSQTPINFRQRYDVYSTPTVYVLDQNKKILARHLPVEDLGGYIDYLQRKK